MKSAIRYIIVLAAATAIVVAFFVILGAGYDGCLHVIHDVGKAWRAQ
jgi:hypothetical protein